MVFYVMGGVTLGRHADIWSDLWPGAGPWAGFVAAYRRLDWNVYFSGSYPLGLLDVFLFWSCAALFLWIGTPRFENSTLPLVIILIAWIAIKPHIFGWCCRWV